MIQISSDPLSSIAPVAGRPALLSTGSSASFALALATQMPGEAASEGEALPGAALPRQAIAGSGKDLPGVAVEAKADDAGEDADAGDAAFAWFQVPVTVDAVAEPGAPEVSAKVGDAVRAPGLAAVAPEALPAETIVATLPSDAPVVAAPVVNNAAAAVAAPVVQPVGAEALPGQTELPGAPVEAAKPAATPAAPIVIPAALAETVQRAAKADAPTVADAPVTPVATQTSAPVEAPAPQAPAAPQQPAATGKPVPAAEAFAAQIAQPAPAAPKGKTAADAGKAEKAPLDPASVTPAAVEPVRAAIRAERTVAPQPRVQQVLQQFANSEQRPITLTAAQLPGLMAEIEGAAPRRTYREAAPAGALAALGGSSDVTRLHMLEPAQEANGVLDMQRQEWPSEMLDRIIALRETPNSRETSIRLSPDALGTIDISISQDGDEIRVHIAAENQAARQALAEAQPRLVELAEARGLKLGMTSVGVDAGTAGQGGQRGDASPQPQMNTSPASARSAESAEAETDQRIA